MPVQRCTFLGALFVGVATAADIATKPHVLFIVADDLGYSDVGCKNFGEFDTPHIDKLINSGRRLDDYYVLPSCSPTRAAIATGVYPARYGINAWLPNESPNAPPKNLTYVAEVLREGGYRTHAVGKWHLGMAQEWMTPTFRGFETFYGYLGGSEDYFEHNKGCDESKCGRPYDFRFDKKLRCDRLCGELLRKEKGTYSTPLFANRTVQIIKEHDVKEPLFVYLAWQAVHMPNEAPPEYIKLYEDRIKDPVRQSFAGMATAMDDGVGQVLDALRAKDMLDDTIVVFTTDNGAFVEKWGWIGGTNFPLRGGKGSVWEGGVRGVGALWTGNRVQVGLQTQTGIAPPTYTPYPGLMHAVDWMATLCDATGTRCPDGIDGVSHWHSLMFGAEIPRTEVFLGYNNEYQTGAAIRVGDWKLIQGDAGEEGIWLPLVKDFEPPWPLHPKPEPYGPLPSSKPLMNLTYHVFNVAADMTERAEQNVPEHLLQYLKTRLHAYTDTAPKSLCCGRTEGCEAGNIDNLPTDPELNMSYWAPWCPVDDEAKVM